MSNVVAIVGRPNVGKSTFFNRLVGGRHAIMDDMPGVTRDRHYGFAEWIGKSFTVIDTGGYVEGSDDVFEAEIRKQVQIAVQEASVILFMVDLDEGLTDLDKEFANLLRREKKPVYIVANKADSPSKALYAAEFYALSLGEVFSISSQTGTGTGELLDKVIQHFSEEEVSPYFDTTLPKITIIGRPNVGKSSMLNALLKEDRSIVTDIEGTTRDAIHSIYNHFGKKFMLIDTAGIRKKAKVKEDIEFYSVLRSIRALEDSDVCIIMLDATRGIEAQDVSLIALADKNRKGIVLVVNKWDLYEKDSKTALEYEKIIRAKTAPIDYYPIIFTSVTEKQRIYNVVEKALEVYDNKTMRISTSKLNEVMLPEIEKTPPPSHRGNYIRIKYITQLPGNSPMFAFFCNNPKYVPESYERFLENRMREHYGFEGVPIKIFMRKK